MTKRTPALIALVVGLCTGLAIGDLAPSLHAAPATPPPISAQGPTAVATGSFAKLAEAVKPAVINVNVESRRAAARTPSNPQQPGDDFFRRFFGDNPEQESRPRRGLGSGVIIDPTGVALTNAHVVDKATQVEVVTLDGNRHTAKVAGVDPKTDLAVLKLEGTGPFPYLKLGNSDELQVGDLVIAVGSPFGLQSTVTQGIVSAKARDIGAGPYDEFIQTDAAINPGNSGGPLVNMRGEVVGINTAIVRGGSGIGFAIPSSMVKRISTDLLASGKVTRGWLGVSMQPLTPELAESFGAKDKKGALVADVMSDSPAAKAGLKAGDIVLEFAGKKISEPGDLARAVAVASPGKKSDVKVLRDKQEKTVTIELGEMPSDRDRVASAAEERGTALLGLEVRPLTPEMARELKLDIEDGVVVTGVEPNSPAAEAGVRRGDVILEVDRKPVKSVAEFQRLAKQVRKDQPLLVRLQRGTSSLYLALGPQQEK